MPCWLWLLPASTGKDAGTVFEYNTNSPESSTVSVPVRPERTVNTFRNTSPRSYKPQADSPPGSPARLSHGQWQPGKEHQPRLPEWSKKETLPNRNGSPDKWKPFPNPPGRTQIPPEMPGLLPWHSKYPHRSPFPSDF